MPQMIFIEEKEPEVGQQILSWSRKAGDMPTKHEYQPEDKDTISYWRPLSEDEIDALNEG